MANYEHSPVHIGFVDPADIRAYLAKTPEELEEKYERLQAEVDDEWRDWLSYYGDDGQLKPGVTLPYEHRALMCAALGPLAPEDRPQYIKEAKAWLGVL